MTRTHADDRRALDLVAAAIVGDIAALDAILVESADTDHLGHLVYGVLEVFEQVLEQLPRAEVTVAVEQIAAVATGQRAIDAENPEMVLLAARLCVAHAINDGEVAAELLNEPVSAQLLLDAVIALHFTLLPALRSPKVLRALQAAALGAEIDAIEE